MNPVSGRHSPLRSQPTKASSVSTSDYEQLNMNFRAHAISGESSQSMFYKS